MKSRTETLKITVYLVMLVLALAWTGVDAAAMTQDRFDEANRLYEEESFEAALEIYREIAQTGDNWKVFYNMGNCYFKLNKPVEAKISYLKAQRLQPFNNGIQKNIGIVNKVLNHKAPGPRPDFVSRVLLRIESIISLNVLSVLLLVTIVIFNLFLFKWVSRGKSRLILYGVSFSLVIALLVAGYHIARVNKHNRRDTAVITAAEAQLRSGPGQNNTILFKVNPGLQVKIIDSSRNWLQVSASSDIAGWIEEEKLERI